MALHGEIKVNGVVIGEWSAVRRGKTEEVNRYDCKVWYIDTEHRRMNAKFAVTHKPQDGALVLASRVLLRARSEAWCDRASD